MKKLFLSFLLIVSVASFSHAQGLKLGLRAGTNIATIAGAGKKAYGSDLKMLLVFHGGITMNAPLSTDGFFSFQPELLYSQKGFLFGGDNGKLTQRFSFIDLPLLARINADGLIFEGGPQLGYLVGARSKIENNRMLNGEVTRLHGYNRFHVGYIAGIGYQFASGPSLTVRYNGGMTGIVEDHDDSMKARNSVIQFSLGYVFGGN